jgi:hypothetical protein
MMQEGLHGAFWLSSLDRRGDERRTAARRYSATATTTGQAVGGTRVYRVEAVLNGSIPAG